MTPPKTNDAAGATSLRTRQPGSLNHSPTSAHTHKTAPNLENSCAPALEKLSPTPITNEMVAQLRRPSLHASAFPSRAAASDINSSIVLGLAESKSLRFLSARLTSCAKLSRMRPETHLKGVSHPLTTGENAHVQAFQPWRPVALGTRVQVMALRACHQDGEKRGARGAVYCSDARALAVRAPGQQPTERRLPSASSPETAVQPPAGSWKSTPAVAAAPGIRTVQDQPRTPRSGFLGDVFQQACHPPKEGTPRRASWEGSIKKREQQPKDEEVAGGCEWEDLYSFLSATWRRKKPRISSSSTQKPANGGLSTPAALHQVNMVPCCSCNSAGVIAANRLFSAYPDKLTATPLTTEARALASSVASVKSHVSSVDIDCQQRHETATAATFAIPVTPVRCPRGPTRSELCSSQFLSRGASPAAGRSFSWPTWGDMDEEGVLDRQADRALLNWQYPPYQHGGCEEVNRQGLLHEREMETEDEEDGGSYVSRKRGRDEQKMMGVPHEFHRKLHQNLFEALRSGRDKRSAAAATTVAAEGCPKPGASAPSISRCSAATSLSAPQQWTQRQSMLYAQPAATVVTRNFLTSPDNQEHISVCRKHTRTEGTDDSCISDDHQQKKDGTGAIGLAWSDAKKNEGEKSTTGSQQTGMTKGLVLFGARLVPGIK